MVTEKQILEIVSQLSKVNDTQQSNSPAPLGKYIFEEYNSVLPSRDFAQLFFILEVIHLALAAPGYEFDIDVFQKHEEENWQLFESVKSKDFRKKLDPFFEITKEEDLLAFLEDILTMDDESELSLIGRDPIFIISKSYMDCLIRN